MSLSPRRLRQRVLENRKILARLRASDGCHGFFRCNLTIACPSAVCLGAPFQACP
jgi:hypothetical protein